MPDSRFSLALVLDRVAYGEKDVIATLLTRDLGVVPVLARSARGSRRRFAGGLDLFVVFQARVKARTGSTLASLLEADVVRQFPGIFESLARLDAGQAVLALARDLLRDAPAGVAAFDHVADAFSYLDAAPPGSEHAALLRACVGLLGDLGHAPRTDACAECGASLRPAGAVLVSDGMLACRECAPARGGVTLGESALDLLGGLREAGPSDREEVFGLVTHLVSSALGRPWKVPLCS